MLYNLLSHDREDEQQLKEASFFVNLALQVQASEKVSKASEKARRGTKCCVPASRHLDRIDFLSAQVCKLYSGLSGVEKAGGQASS